VDASFGNLNSAKASLRQAAIHDVYNQYAEAQAFNRAGVSALTFQYLSFGDARVYIVAFYLNVKFTNNSGPQTDAMQGQSLFCYNQYAGCGFYSHPSLAGGILVQAGIGRMPASSTGQGNSSLHQFGTSAPQMVTIPVRQQFGGAGSSAASPGA
jgi:hypothetical protein